LKDIHRRDRRVRREKKIIFRETPRRNGMQAAANENIYACGRLTIDIETNLQIVFARSSSPDRVKEK